MIDKGQWREFCQDTGVTPLLFTRSAMGFLMTSESQDLGLTAHPKDSPFWQYSVPVTGALGPTQTTGWAPPAVLTNTSSNSNLVIPWGFPSRYWPGSTLLSFSGQLVLGCMVIWLWLSVCVCAASGWIKTMRYGPSLVLCRGLVRASANEEYKSIEGDYSLF